MVNKSGEFTVINSFNAKQRGILLSSNDILKEDGLVKSTLPNTLVNCIAWH